MSKHDMLPSATRQSCKQHKWYSLCRAKGMVEVTLIKLSTGPALNTSSVQCESPLIPLKERADKCARRVPACTLRAEQHLI